MLKLYNIPPKTTVLTMTAPIWEGEGPRVSDLGFRGHHVEDH